MRIVKYIAPLKVKKSKHKYFNLNLNNYRNAHYMVLNNTKKAFCNEMELRYPCYGNPRVGKITTKYTIYAGTKRKFDLPNVCSIVQKYFEDWLVERGEIETDDITVINKSVYIYGGVDKENPRAEIEIHIKN